MKNTKLIKGYRYFEAQERGEEVLLIIRRHWLVLASPFLKGFLGTIIMIGFSYLIFDSPLLKNSLYSEMGLKIVVALSVLYGSLYSFSAWLVKYLNVLILTNKHIVDITQNAFFSRKVSSLELDSIEDVATLKKGIFPSLFDYGNLYVQTAGELPNFEIDKIPDPEGAQRAIMEAKENYTKNFSNHSNGFSGDNF